MLLGSSDGRGQASAGRLPAGEAVPPGSAGDEAAPPGSAGSQTGPPGSTASVRAVVGRAALVIVAATLTGRLLGLVRDIVVAYFFGAQAETDAFFLAYKVPYLLTLVVSGALIAAFVPLFSHRIATGNKKDALALFANMGKVACLVLIGVTVILVVLAPWIIPLIGFGFDAATKDLAVYLFRLLMIGFVFAGLTGLVTGMLNSLRRFALAAFAPAAGTAVTLIITIVFAGPVGIASLAVGSAVGWVVGLAVVLLGIRDQDVPYRAPVQWRDPALREATGMVWPVLIGSAVGTVAIFTNQILGSLLEVGSVSSLSYADKLFQVPLGLFVAGITVPIFPLLSEQVAAKAPERVKATLSFALRLMAFLLIPSTVAFILLRYAIIGLILEHGKFTAEDTARTAWALLFLLLGLYVYAGRDTLTRVFYAHHDTRTPVKISVATVVVNVGLSYVFMQVLGVGGLALGTTVALTLNFFVLLYLLRRKIGPMGLGRLAGSLLRVAGASAVMGVVVWAVDYGLSRAIEGTASGDAIRVVVGLTAGLLTYVFAAKLMKSPELAEVKDMMRTVFRRS
jgi:putative peptidoglycan lipid II flippase